MSRHPAPSLPPQVAPPELTTSPASPYDVTGAEVVALAVLPPEGDGGGVVLGPGSAELSERLGLDLVGALEVQRATGAAGEVVAVPVLGAGGEGPGLVLLVGVGAARPDDLRRAGAALARACTDRSVVASTVSSVAGDEALEAFVAGVVLGAFGFSWRSTAPQTTPVGTVVVCVGSRAAARAAAPVVERAVALGRAGWRARWLASVPSNVKSPQWLAEQAREIGEAAGLDVTVWDEGRLERDGFGGIIAIGKASATPPRLVRLDYRPRRGARSAPTVVLVGKGITFDTGGLSIKPAEGMTTMKRDMTGGAVVIATMAALAAVGCPVRVVGLVPMAENAVGGNAVRPGDVVRHWGGRTTEVTNTDAEGRVVLADALAYAVAELAPAAVVDVATLTGAMKVALGQQVGGYFANDDALAALLEGAGAAAGEPLWRFPLSALYEDKLASKVADADNAPGGPGAITAALFLQHFVAGVPWAHLDIASVGDAPKDSFEWSAGPTGFGARALLTWLGAPDPLAGVRPVG